ncbi:hypothetical protein AOQ84DRAFT_137326 [Glonium stellatum]|uniref:Chromosome transmission fidelity protein 8 n=1 Tax=Glonium stellatum TaxID=574774 RepID=A0A8E2F926_9PEZI|nr:hypothetical protein AOQ84DRAFT_137326 [Glonium stellatum]
MPSIPLYLPNLPASEIDRSGITLNPLPRLLQTPGGRAILEIQGTIHAPALANSPEAPESTETPIGNLVFPLYSEGMREDDTQWMKRVYLYIGKHQRLTGEVKKLAKPLGVLGRRIRDNMEDMEGVEGPGGVENEPVERKDGDELEILEVVRYKIIFSTRPEPVGGEVLVS